jgi:hypothetical protein
MVAGRSSELVHPRDIRDGDVIQDPNGRSGWITVTRIVSGPLTASSGGEEASTTLWSFYGDERLDEAITVHSDDVSIARLI